MSKEECRNLNISTKAIVIIAFSRPDLLRQTLNSVNNASANAEFQKIIVWQTNSLNYEQVGAVVEEFSEIIDVVFKIDGSKRTPIHNITHNQTLAMHYSFEFLNCSWIVLLEEDTQLAFDALVFAKNMMCLYGKRRDFRAINLGSITPIESSSKFTYSLLRFGPHLHAMVITNELWKKYKLKNFMNRTKKMAIDSFWGPYFLTGFVVTPNASRSLDSGREGTHVKGPEMQFYFDGQIQSWLGGSPFAISEYERQDSAHNWRAGTVPTYRRRLNVIYQIRRIVIRFDELVLHGSLIKFRTNRKM